MMIHVVICLLISIVTAAPCGAGPSLGDNWPGTPVVPGCNYQLTLPAGNDRALFTATYGQRVNVDIVSNGKTVKSCSGTRIYCKAENLDPRYLPEARLSRSTATNSNRAWAKVKPRFVASSSASLSKKRQGSTPPAPQPYVPQGLQQGSFCPGQNYVYTMLPGNGSVARIILQTNVTLTLMQAGGIIFSENDSWFDWELDVDSSYPVQWEISVPSSAPACFQPELFELDLIPFDYDWEPEPQVITSAGTRATIAAFAAFLAWLSR